MKRVFLFLATNLAVLVMFGFVLSIVSTLLGIPADALMGRYSGLFVYALVAGFLGAGISLAFSRILAKKTMGLQMVDVENPGSKLEAWLVNVIRSHTEKVGLPMPEVAIYEGEPNAFATGPTKSRSLVAVSTGLLSSMNRREVEAVLAHEVSHIANGDMVTMTLVQGVLNTFVVFLSRVAASVAAGAMRSRSDDEQGSSLGNSAVYMLVATVLDLVLGLLASMLVAAYSRRREYEADAGAAEIMGSREPMIAALRRLGGEEAQELPASLKGFGISGGIGSLMASHPSIEDRIASLQRRFSR